MKQSRLAPVREREEGKPRRAQERLFVPQWLNVDGVGSAKVSDQTLNKWLDAIRAGGRPDWPKEREPQGRGH